ncbi:TRM11 family SAM-dependent methyltransferase [Cerasicoccus arenae]|uniref:Ribosomal RNA large subunit methyltransferase K/L-like methyltransferase domain-containing protein n=1 Tax=Cerasicoccus arenae TaxID=424488 RepID=A0A8J3DJW9_9BACT|nr:methyltransferase [Cerasicoccus arenae]MBK1858928.1 methyltransferase [Cerasicoccus arenae]GHC08259.1 hypothetical protein GCM10007047_26880 [Cerasicoccus arenae]
MKVPKKKKHRQKEQFRELSQLSVAPLWEMAGPYAAAPDAERQGNVALIRAIGVVIGQQGNTEDKARAREWAVSRLNDSLETVRRYAMNALPRLDAGSEEEQALLALMERGVNERERAEILETLQKIGGQATLEQLAGDKADFAQRVVEQKLSAKLVRADAGAIDIEQTYTPAEEVFVALRCRPGLEQVLEDEIRAHREISAALKLDKTARGVIYLRGKAPLSLGLLYQLRCFDTLGFILGRVDETSVKVRLEKIAALIAAPATVALMSAFTNGALRYRLHFDTRKRQNHDVIEISDLVYAREPKLLNDSRQAPWTIQASESRKGLLLELSPHGTSDPRFQYRRGDIPAASHPPLAATIVRLANIQDGQVVWDPFCGTGSELVEARLSANLSQCLGTDISPEALEIAKGNWAQAGFSADQATWIESDFRDSVSKGVIPTGQVDAIISNPPMGRRVPIEDLGQLIEELFAAAAKTLRPGGSLVLVNPVKNRPDPRDFRSTLRTQVDMGGFHGWLEKHERIER